jgi:hypothetical protein
MLRRSEPPGGFELEAVAQDVLIADLDIMAVSSLRMAVALAIAVIPALLIVASYPSTLWAARVRSSLTRRDDAGLFAFSPSEHVDPSAGGNSPTPSQQRPVERLYRVTFPDETAFREWTRKVTEFASTLRDIPADVTDSRPVVFVQLTPPRGVLPYAYVSTGARGLASALVADAKLDSSPVPVSELPDGLGLLYGDVVDTAAYERRAQAVPVRFQDEHGLAWTVTRKAGRQAGRVMLEFVSSAGERRACEVVSLDDGDWEALSERAWRTILQEASGHPDRPR